MNAIVKSFLVGLIGFLFVVMTIGLSYGAEQKYPIAPVNVIVPSTPGGTADLMMRALGEFFRESLGQPFVITYKPGGGGMIGGNAIVTAKPDGYTIGVFWVAPSIPEVFRYFQEPPYTSKDLRSICKIANEVGILVVKPDNRWNNLKDVVEYMKKNPGMLKFGSAGGKMGSAYILMSKVARIENTNFTHVSFQGDPETAFNVLGGHVPIGFTTYATGTPHIMAGTLKVIAVYSERRYDMIPQVPTFAEQGYSPDTYPCYGLFAPKDTPDEIIQKISETVKKAYENPLYLERLKSFNLQAAFENTDQFRETLTQYKIDLEKSLRAIGCWKE